MRLYRGKFEIIAREIVASLRKSELVEISDENIPEAELDVVGVLREYNRMDRELSNRARDIAHMAGTNHMTEKRRLARDRGFKFGDEALDYLINQIIEAFMHSAYVDEIYGEDNEVRAKINPIVKYHTQDREDELDKEVRAKIKNLKEGSTAFDIEYEKLASRLRARKGMN